MGNRPAIDSFDVVYDEVTPMKDRSLLPTKYVKKFNKILKQLEHETHQIYELNVLQYGKPINGCSIIGSLKHRHKYIVCQLNPEFSELEGTYLSFDLLLSKLNFLRQTPYLKYDELSRLNMLICPLCSKSMTAETSCICGFKYDSRYNKWRDVDFLLCEGIVSFVKDHGNMEMIGKIVII